MRMIFSRGSMREMTVTSSGTQASLDEVAWYGANSEDETHPVGMKKPNAWGLYDMLGRLGSGLRTCMRGIFLTIFLLADPTGPQGSGAVRPKQFAVDPQMQGGPRDRLRHLPCRGGAWDNPAGFVRVSVRYHCSHGPTLKVSDMAFA